MLERLLPQSADNDFRGMRIALWVLGLVLLMKLAMGFNCIVNGRMVAVDADGIPLGSFTSDGAQTVVALFGVWGVAQIVISLAVVVVLVRYRALVPLAFMLLLLEHLLRKGVLHFVPVVRTTTTTSTWVNLGLLGLVAVGLLLSLWRKPPLTGDPSAAGR